MAKTVATPADVRLFAVQNGFTVGTRGRFSDTLISAFNKDSGMTYKGKPVTKRTVKAIRVNPATGRKTPITKGVTVADVREAATAAGVTLNAGRISDAAYRATVTGDWTPVTDGTVTDVQRIRAAASAAGVQVGTRGRISAEIRARFAV